MFRLLYRIYQQLNGLKWLWYKSRNTLRCTVNKGSLFTNEQELSRLMQKITLISCRNTSKLQTKHKRNAISDIKVTFKYTD